MSHFILEEPKEFDIELHFLKEQLNRNKYVHSYEEIKEPHQVGVVYVCFDRCIVKLESVDYEFYIYDKQNNEFVGYNH